MFIGEKRLIQFIAVAALSFALGVGPPSASRADDDPAPAAAAADAKAAKDAEPTTTKDPQIALDDLELLLAPMTKEETETEAKGWYSLLRAKEREITVAELDVRRKNREIAQLEKQKTAAADLAKATEEGKAATSDKDKEAAAQHLAEAQKNLAQTVKTASKETANEEKKAEATTAAMAKQADAAPPPAAIVDSGTPAAGVKVVPASSDKDVLQKATESAAKKSEGPGDTAKVEKPFDVGDDVEVGGGIKGKVTHVTIFSTYIRTDDGITKIVPNDNIWKSVIVNETTGVVKAPPASEPQPPEAKPGAA